MGGLVIGDEGGIAQSLWKKSTNESIFAIYTPYILSLASGKLDSGSFLHCIFQDLQFLQASAEAFDMAEECSDDDDDKAVIRKIRKRVLKKMTMFRSIVQEWGFELPAGNISDRAMTKYTDFLLDTASGKSVREKFRGKFATPFEKTKLSAYALAAMAPSMRIHLFLSKEIQAVLEPDENIHLYKKWIDSLASQKFEDSASQIEELLDKLTVSLTGEELQFVETIYHKAMKLQVDFFSAQPITQNTVVPLYRAHGNDEHNVLICSGFDMTCSAVDSGALLADVAIIKSSQTVKSNGYESSGDGTSLVDLRNIWSGLHSQYVEEYEQCIDNIMLSEKDPQDLEYVSQIKRVLELLKKNRDMLFSEVKLTVMIEDPREVERRRLLGIDDADAPTREDLAAVLEEVNEGKIPRDRVALQMLPEEMVQWPNLEVEATKKGPRKSLYATKII